jgi:predicted nucleic acid-binding protein
MQIIVADTSALALASASGLLDVLPEQFSRIILSPAVVDELVEHDIIDDLMESAVERIMEVVSLTQQDETLALQLGEELATLSTSRNASTHRGEAEALALMERGDLAPQLFLCDDGAAQQVARERGIPVQGFLALVAGLRGDDAAARVRAARLLHEPDEVPDGYRQPAAPPPPAPPAPKPPRLDVDSNPPLTNDGSLLVEIDEETAALLSLLVERGIGSDPGEIVRRAVRGLASALDV